MIVYHGSYLKIETPRIITSEKGRDFGFGFYTTTIKAQAERWAVRIAKLHSRITQQPCDAVINVYEYNPDGGKSLKNKDFPNADGEWLDMVINCRTNPVFRHGFDIVSGKIANDSVGETVEYVIAGVMRKEDAIERLRFEEINNQICFCTEAALQTISFKDSYTIPKTDLNG